jgi:hypothetical protein
VPGTPEWVDLRWKGQNGGVEIEVARDDAEIGFVCSTVKIELVGIRRTREWMSHKLKLSGTRDNKAEQGRAVADNAEGAGCLTGGGRCLRTCVEGDV